MPDSLTNNLQLLEMNTGTASGTWGSLLNSAVIQILDQALGSTQSVSLSSANVTLTMTQRQNLAFALSGTLLNNVSVSLPFNANSTTVAVGGEFIFDNETTGAFSVTVKTAASGSTGVEVPQGTRALLYSDTTNVWFADDTQNQTQTVSGNPNGSVAGKAGSASTRASKIIDRAANIEYLCTTSGTASSAVWFPNLPFPFPSEGYLTASSDTNNPVITSDSIGATTIYYTGFNGDRVFLWNGTSFAPFQITGGQLSLALSGSAQASNGIYDVLAFPDPNNAGQALLGFSPAWSINTAGSCSRGTGAGTPQMTRIRGVPVNTVQQTANNGATTYTVAANRGAIVGSVFIDSTAGQVTCHRSGGQNRKFGIWNTWNQQPIILQGFDSTGSWTQNGSYRASNGDSNNRVTAFTGLPTSMVDVLFSQFGSIGANAGIISAINAIGINTTTAASGRIGQVSGAVSSSAVTIQGIMSAGYELPPTLGITNIQAMDGPGTGQVSGGALAMMLRAYYFG